MGIFTKNVGEAQFWIKSDRITDNSREDACTFMYSLVTNTTIFVLVSMVASANFTFVTMVTKGSTDFMVTVVTFFADVSKVSQLLWLLERDMNFTEAIPLCDNISVYIFTSDTTIIKYTIVMANKLKISGYMFRPHRSPLQANLHTSSTYNVRTVWDPIVCTIIIYV